MHCEPWVDGFGGAGAGVVDVDILMFFPKLHEELLTLQNASLVHLIKVYFPHNYLILNAENINHLDRKCTKLLLGNAPKKCQSCID